MMLLVWPDMAVENLVVPAGAAAGSTVTVQVVPGLVNLFWSQLQLDCPNWGATA